MTQSLQRQGRGPYETSTLNPIQPTLSRQDTVESGQRFGQSFGQQISPATRPARLSAFDGSSQNAGDRTAEENATAIHQQEQRGVSQLQNAVSAATGGSARTALAGSPGPAQAGMYAQPGAMLGDLKRGGPVEFNHAISYVNKIKVCVSPEMNPKILLSSGGRHSLLGGVNG